MDELLELAEEWDLTLGTVSNATRTVYGRAVQQFAEWLAKAHPKLITVGDIRRGHIDGWMRYLEEDLGRSGATRRVRVVALRLFFAYVAGETDLGLTANPAAKVALPTPKEKVVPLLHDEAVRLTEFLERPRATGTSWPPSPRPRSPSCPTSAR